MTRSAVLTLVQEKTDIQRVLNDRALADLTALPPVWQAMARLRGTTNLSDQARADYVEVARIFAVNMTPHKWEALHALGNDFDRARYPDLAQLQLDHTDGFPQRGLTAISELFAAFGYAMPAAFYQLLVALVTRNSSDRMIMFRDEATMKRDQLWDAVIHAAQLCGSIGLYMQSVFSKQGLKFEHLVMCSCITIECNYPPFEVSLDQDLKPLYLQNLVAGALMQYE